MCGIAGVLTVERPVDAALVAATLRMLDSQVHRGPDDWGILVPEPAMRDPDIRGLLEPRGLDHVRTYRLAAGGPAVVLGARRLSIIDLSPAGRQPMASETGGAWIAYNGEVYNHRELREELEGKGYKFRSDTDTEVIVRGYEAWGEGVVPRLRGMFAFGILDLRAPVGGGQPIPRLFVARDRFGMKPLYHASRRGDFVFSSEIGALLASGLVSSEGDPDAAARFLVWGSIPAPGTAWRSVQALPPGHWLKVTSGDVSSAPYWNLAGWYASQSRRAVSLDRAAVETRAALADSVRAHLVSDVPVGAFLSGGIDSSAIVALMRETGQSRIKTVSVVFPDTAYDESRWARLVAERFETAHLEVPVTSRDFLEHLDRIFASMDQPTIDGVNTYFVSMAARLAGLKVALAGLGGDELFGGYASFRLVPRLHQLRRLLGDSKWAARAARVLAASQPSRRTKIEQLLEGPSTLHNAYMVYRGLFMPEELAGLLPGGAPLPDLCAHLLPQTPGSITGREAIHPREAVHLMETGGYMASQLLRDTDVFSMAHSLEVRTPYVDEPLVATVAAFARADWAAQGTKPLLAAAMRGLVPGAVIGRSKMGFTFPIEQWLRGDARSTIEDLLRGGGVFPEAAVADAWSRFRSGRLHWSRIWALTVWTAHARAQRK